HNVVDNCFIHDTTRVFHGSVGVLVGSCAAYNRITHNEICYGDYTGISIGWGWSAKKTSGYHQPGNVVEYNHVHHMMNYQLDDGGGIYLLGWQKGARVCYNWIHDVRHDSLGHGAKGIYPDQGTSGVLFEGNVVHDVAQGFGGNGGHECIVRDNIFAFSQKSGVIGGGKHWNTQVKYNPNPVLFERNIVSGDEGVLMGTRFQVAQQNSRRNIYWPAAAKPADELFGDGDTKAMTFAAWQKKGHDIDSVIADPLFVNAAKRDLRLRPDSPALKMGFKQTDLSKVGLYGDRAWTSLPQRVKHAPIVSHPGPVEFEWTYEDEFAGAPPTHSGVLCLGKPELQHRIEVTDADAASGRRCLKFVEGKSEGASYFPFLRYPVGADAGPVEASLRLKMPAANPAALYVSFRDYKNRGNKHFQTGPRIELNTKGILTGPEGSDLAVQLPHDTWVALKMTFAVGREARKVFDLSVSIPGQALRVYRNVPFLDPGFLCVSRIYIVSTGPAGGTFL
ncbi:MAG: right-handed parallel beta-helix repeat-containing protein, partial [Lentisphaeria bacterium]|nr:right-handed parallel beta-helix repeat-containing protein [Lentisphaeria bacterium]